MDDPLADLFWRDELLQILFWFEGEGFGEAVAARELLPFLDASEGLIAYHLERLVAEGAARRVPGDPARYCLTEWGSKEGGRRFADEFSGLTHQAHLECNNPDCACKTMGPAACAGGHSH